MFIYRTKGTCASEIHLMIDNNVIKSCEFIGGCAGNLLGIGTLVTDMNVDEAINRLKGIDCRSKGTSCPDQLALALEEYKNK